MCLDAKSYYEVQQPSCIQIFYANQFSLLWHKYTNVKSWHWSAAKILTTCTELLFFSVVWEESIRCFLAGGSWSMLALDICNRNEDKEYRISDKFKIKKTVFKCTHTFSNNADVEHYDKNITNHVYNTITWKQYLLHLKKLILSDEHLKFAEPKNQYGVYSIHVRKLGEFRNDSSNLAVNRVQIVSVFLFFSECFLIIRYYFNYHPK